MAWHGIAGKTRPGKAWTAAESPGLARNRRLGESRTERRGWASQARPGEARDASESQASYGGVRRVPAWPVGAPQARFIQLLFSYV